MRYFIAVTVTIIFLLIIAAAFADEWGDSSIITVEKAALRKFDYEGGADVIYLGKNANPDAADSDTDWVIFKYTYVSEQVTQIERTTGTWTGRADLF